ncbi:unnamed protein product [Heterobilharzia americana]|nr:unnamed protein product [Heterobilharzia americana]
MKSSICFPENYEKIEQKAKKLTRIGNSSSKSDSSFTNNSVDSLYQTRKSTLLYGKNNVMLGDEQRVPGYLELINSSSDILIRWTSNDLLLQASDMNISRSNGIEYDCDQYLLDNPLNETNTTEPMNVNKYSRINNQLVENNTAADKYYSFHFDVVTISVNKMQYVHLHQGGSFEYQIVFIGLDGIAYPPIRLQGGLKAVYDFLVCLDQGLRPSAFLNPSPTDLSATEFDQEQNRKPVSKQQTTFKLWSFINFRNEIIGSKSTSKQLNDQINEITDNSSNMDKKDEELKGVVNENKINNKLEISSISKLRNCNNKEIEEVIFKIVRSEVLTDNDDDVFFGQNTKQIRTKSCKLLPDNKSKMPVTIIEEQSKLSHIESLNSTDIIDTIKVQLVLKTFRAWLVYTQNMKNVRKLLSTLVIHPAKILSNSSERQCEELTKTKWCELFLNVPDKQNFNPHCIYECIYLGGCASEIRNEVWPYLLGIYKWSMTDAEKNTVDEQLQEHYKSKLKEWMKMEEDIRKIEEKSTITKSSASQNTDWENLMQDPSSSNIDYQETVLKQFAHALESVKKDVVRCDRNNCFYSKSDSSGDRNLAIIQRILLTYVWEFLDDEYTQGMCDIVAPLLVLKLENSLTSRQSTDLHLSNTTPTAVNKCKPMNEQREMEQEEVSGEIEIGTYILFKQIMENRMKKLFSRETATFYMDQKFDHIKSLIQVLDPHLIGHLQKFSDFTHFYFCYRWFLLDFKREFKYQDVFRIWEVILCAEHLISKDFSLFIALALIQNYRDVICANHMEFTDILKFFNERAEKHNVEDILNLARHFAATIQTLTSRIKET